MKSLASALLAVLAAGGAAPAAAQLSDAQRARQGEGVYRNHCAQCHGPRADGQGVLAKRFNPPPSDLAASRRGDDYWLQIITVGGLNMGRSSVMPEWGLELSAQEILAVVYYLREVNDAAVARARTRGGAAPVAHRRRGHG